ncbi:MAG: nucleoside deaminase [Chloroflexota bacterium]
MHPQDDGKDHEPFMREALKEAKQAMREGERPIGAVVVHDGRIIGRGRAQHRARNSEIAHAELNALIDAEQYLHEHTHECVIYTTVEPCVMCLGAIVMSDIDHVVYALADNWIKPREMMDMMYVRRHIKTYLGGVLEDESAELWEMANPSELRLLQGGDP